jgi:hypothetical protein
MNVINKIDDTSSEHSTYDLKDLYYFIQNQQNNPTWIELVHTKFDSNTITSQWLEFLVSKLSFSEKANTVEMKDAAEMLQSLLFHIQYDHTWQELLRTFHYNSPLQATSQWADLLQSCFDIVSEDSSSDGDDYE